MFELKKSIRIRKMGNEILMSVRASKKQSKETSIHSPIGVDKEGNEITLC